MFRGGDVAVVRPVETPSFKSEERRLNKCRCLVSVPRCSYFEIPLWTDWRLMLGGDGGGGVEQEEVEVWEERERGGGGRRSMDPFQQVLACLNVAEGLSAMR